MNQELEQNSAHITIETSQTKSEWELTWPIWHMLPRDERKAIALKHGMKTIGEFEEYMSLHKAEAVSAAMSTSTSGASGTTGRAYSNAATYSNDSQTNNDVAEIEKKFESLEMKENDQKIPALKSDNDSSDNEEEEEELEEEENFHEEIKQDRESLSYEELIEQGGQMLRLPIELHQKILSYLEVDYYSLCALVHPTWSSFTRTEQSYQIICKRLYLKQSKFKKLRVHKFQNSYHKMLMTRPRVRTGTGFYILKYKKVKKIQRDMWTEIPIGAILETVYYRYLYFFENGLVLYALTTASPVTMVSRIQKMIKYDNESNKSVTKDINDKKQNQDNSRDTNGGEYKDKQLVWGRYEVSKYDVQVRAKQSWCNVILDMKIIPNGYGSNGGKFCTMALVRHRTSTEVDFDEYGFGDEKKEAFGDNSYYNYWNPHPNIVEHSVPSECFQFVRDWRL